MRFILRYTNPWTWTNLTISYTLIITAHYICLELILCNLFLPIGYDVNVQYFTLLVGQSQQTCLVMLTLFVWTLQLDQRTVGTKTTTHKQENLVTCLMLGEQNDYKMFCSWIIHRLLNYSKLLPLLSLKEILTCQMNLLLSQRSSTTLGYSAKGNASEDLRFIWVTSQSTEIIVRETCLLFCRQTITEWILRSAVQQTVLSLLISCAVNCVRQTSFDWQHIVKYCNINLL
jgi:hypothetical protein